MKSSQVGSLICVLLFIFSCQAQQTIPLNKDSYGFTVGDPQGKLHIEFFLDFLCPDSLASYKEFIEVQKSIDFSNQGIKFTYQFSPLTWHFYAFKINQAFFFVLQERGAQQAAKFISHVFANQQAYAQEKWMDKSINDFLDFFALQISKATLVSQSGLRKELQFGSATFDKARYHWKYTVSNGVAGAPLFNLNGVRIDGAEQFKSADWIKFFQQYKIEDSQPNPIFNLNRQKLKAVLRSM